MIKPILYNDSLEFSKKNKSLLILNLFIRLIHSCINYKPILKNLINLLDG